MQINNVHFFAMNAFMQFVIFTLKHEGYIFLSLLLLFEVIILNEHYLNKNMLRNSEKNHNGNDDINVIDDGISIFSRRVRRLSKRYSGIIKSRMNKNRMRHNAMNHTINQQDAKTINDIELPTLKNLNEIYSTENQSINNEDYINTTDMDNGNNADNDTIISTDAVENQCDIEVVENVNQTPSNATQSYFKFTLF